jgi:hypothetical protein
MIGGSIPGRGWEFFSSAPPVDRLWGSPSLLSNGYQGLFPWRQSCRSVELSIHLHVVLRSRMLGAIFPLPNTPSWRRAQLKKHRDNFTFIFTFTFTFTFILRIIERLHLKGNRSYRIILSVSCGLSINFIFHCNSLSNVFPKSDSLKLLVWILH